MSFGALAGRRVVEAEEMAVKREGKTVRRSVEPPTVLITASTVPIK